MTQQDDARPEPLSEEVREHLGRRLRLELRAEEERPAFLGDETVPARFTSLLHQLERRELSSQKGVEAIRKEFGLPEE